MNTIYRKGDMWSLNPIAMYDAVEIDDKTYELILSNKISLKNGKWIDNSEVKETYLESLERRIKAVEDKLTKVK